MAAITSVCIKLILVIITFFVGVMLLLVASRIGEWWFNIYREMRRELPGPIPKIAFAPFTSPLFFVWLLRIIGIFCIGAAVFIIYIVMFAK